VDKKVTRLAAGYSLEKDEETLLPFHRPGHYEHTDHTKVFGGNMVHKRFRKQLVRTYALNVTESDTAHRRKCDAAILLSRLKVKYSIH
jgi:hypothetical protein